MTTKDMLLQYAKTNVATATPTPSTRVESPKTVADMLLNHASDVRTGRAPAVKLESVVPVKPQAVNKSPKTFEQIKADFAAPFFSDISTNQDILEAIYAPEKAGATAQKQVNAAAKTANGFISAADLGDSTEQLKRNREVAERLLNNAYAQAERSYAYDSGERVLKTFDDALSFYKTAEDEYNKDVKRYADRAASVRSEAEIDKSISIADTELTSLQRQKSQYLQQADALMQSLGRDDGRNYAQRQVVLQQINNLKSLAAELDPQIKRMQEMRGLYEEEQGALEMQPYMALMQNADFDELSKYATRGYITVPDAFDTFVGNEGRKAWADPLYEYINGNQEAGDYLFNEAVTRYGGGAVGTLIGGITDSDREMFNLTDVERKIFNYLYAKDTEAGDMEHKNAYGFVEKIHTALTARERQKLQEDWAKYASENPLQSSLFSVLSSPLKGISYLGQFTDYADDGEIEQNAAYNQFSHIPVTIRDEISDNIEKSGKWGKIGSFAYNTGMSFADFLYTTAISGGFSREAMGKIGQNIGLAIMGSGAAADTVISAKDRGLSDDQAFALGTVAGVAEIAMERIGLETLFNNLGSRKALRAILMQGLAEGGEEVGTEVINTVADVLISQDQSQWQASIENYMAQGYSQGEAVSKAVADKALEIGVSGFAGFLMGGGMAAGFNAPVIASNIKDAVTKKQAQSQIQPSPGEISQPVTNDIAGAENGVQAQKNTASTEAVNNYVDVAISKSRFVENPVITDKVEPPLSIGAVTPELSNKIASDYGVDISSYTHYLVENDLRHIYNRHGPHTSEKYPVTIADLKAIPQIIQSADEVYYVPRDNGKKGLVYQYRHNGTTYFLEQIADNNMLVNKQMIKVPTGTVPNLPGLAEAIEKKQNKSTRLPGDAADAVPQMYVQDASGAFNKSIPQTSENSNSDFLSEVWGISQNTGAQQEQALDENGNPLPSGVGAMSSSYAVETGRSKVGSNTFANSSIFSEAEKELLGTNEMSYYVLSEQESMERAADRLAIDFNGEMEDLQAWTAWSGDDLDTAMGILSELTRKARESGDYTEVRKWTKLIQDRGTTGGQFVQAFAKYSRTPEGIMVRATDALENTKLSEEQKNEILHNVEVEAAKLHDLQDGDKQAAIDLILETSRIRKTGSFFKNTVSKMLQKALAADSFDHLKQVATAGVESIAEDYIPQTTADKVYSIRKLFMLSNLATVVRNFVGNNVFDPIDAFAGSTAMVPLDILLSKITGTRSIAVDKSWLSAAKRKGAMEGVLKSYIEVALDVNPRGLESRYESNGTRSFKMTGNLIERFLSTMAKYQGYTLLTTDEFQKGGIAAETQRGLDALKAKGAIADESLDTQAQEMAKYRTFQKDSTTAKAVAKIKSGADSFGNDWIRFGDLMVPFAKVPANLAEIAAIDYSPTGAVRGVAELVNVLRAAKAGTLTAAQQAKALNDIGRGLTGTGLITFFTLAALSGILRVAGSDDEDEKALETAEGITGTQLNVSALSRFLKGESTAWQDGDELFSIQFLEPINAQMTTGAMLAEEIKDGDFSAGDILKKTFAGSWESILQLPVMESIQTFFNNFNYSKAESDGERFADAAASFLASQASSFVIPNAVRAIAKGTDPIVRDVRARSNTGDAIKDIWFDTIDSFKSGVPGLRQTIQPSLDNYGRERTYGDNPFVNFLNATVFPGSVTEYRTNALEEEQKRLTTATGKSVIPNKEAPASISNAGTKYTLSLDEQDAFQKLYGDTIESVGNLIMEDPAFSVFSDTQKSEIMADINAYALDIAKRSLVEQQGGEYKSSAWSGEDTFTAEEFATYLMYRQAIGDMKASKGADDDAFQQLADMYESLTAEEKDIVDDMDGFEKAYAAAQSGMDMQNYYGLKDAYSAVKSSKGADAQAFIDLMPFYDTLNAGQKEIFNPENDKTIGKLATAYKAGIDPQKYYEVKATLATITGNTQQADKLNSMSGLTPSQKKVLENLLISDYRMISSEINYDYSSQSAYGFSKLSESAQKVYNAELTGSGISKSDYTKAVNFKNGADSTDEDGDGKADTFSIGKQVLDYIDGLSLTDAQKQALAVSMGYSEKNIDKYAPWN